MLAVRGDAANAIGNKTQKGYTIIAVIVLLLILSMLCAVAFRNSKTDLTLAKKTQINVRSNFIAESAVNWALSELRRPRGDFVPYTKATHDPTGNDTLSYLWPDGTIQGRKLLKSEVFAIYTGVSIQVDSKGWIYQQTTNPALSISGLASSTKRERLAFKIWYPSSPVNSVRVSAKGVLGTDSSQVEFIGTFKDVFIAN